MTNQTRSMTVSSGQWPEVATAIDYLAGLERPGFTVWDAVDEAVRW